MDRVFFVDVGETALRERIKGGRIDVTTGNGDYLQDRELFITEDRGVVESEVKK